MELKKSSKMTKAVESLVAKYNFKPEEIAYGTEVIASNRYREGYYDYAELHCPITRLHFIVAYDGTITRM